MSVTTKAWPSRQTETEIRGILIRRFSQLWQEEPSTSSEAQQTRCATLAGSCTRGPTASDGEGLKLQSLVGVNSGLWEVQLQLRRALRSAHQSSFGTEPLHTKRLTGTVLFNLLSIGNF